MKLFLDTNVVVDAVSSVAESILLHGEFHSVRTAIPMSHDCSPDYIGFWEDSEG